MDKVKILKPKRNLSKEELDAMPKDELVLMIMSLEAHTKQLKNILEKKSNPKTKSSMKKDTGRKLDFTKSHKRHVLIKFLYLGWDYEGYVIQEHTNETIEFYLFEALSKICLIEARETSNYNRCGRTDKGVSAFEQVISIDVRSKVKPEEQMSQAGIESELNYCLLLNRVLPKQIRAISWMPVVTPNYSARFDCIGRTYKYFFPRGDLNIEKMQEACNNLVGSHDFRNFCKMDVGNGVVTYIRRLDHVQIKTVTKNHEGLTEFDMLYLEIKGSAFLWHQIRCIVAILMLIGQQKESPDVIKELLDVEKYDKKPQYSLASEIPLNLFHCNFRDEPVEGLQMHNKWIFDEESLRNVVVDLQEHWCSQNIKTTMIYEMQKVLQREYSENFPGESEIIAQVSYLNRDAKCREYQKLQDRQKSSSLEDRIDHFTKRRRIVKVEEAVTD